MSASRSGVRLTPISAARCTSLTRAPAGSRPSTIISRTVSASEALMLGRCILYTDGPNRQKVSRELEQSLRFQLAHQRQPVMELKGLDAEGAGRGDVFQQVVDGYRLLRQRADHLQRAVEEIGIGLGALEAVRADEAI